MTPPTDQLALDLAQPEHRPGRDLDYVRAAVVDAQLRAAQEAFKAARAPATCRCTRPLIDGDRCAKCGRGVRR